MSLGKKTTSSSLRHRLTLQQEVQTPDGAGGYTRSWQDVSDLWAEIISLNGTSVSSRGAGKEIVFAGQLQAQVTHKVTLRYRDGVTAAMRLVFENRVFNILSVTDVGENREVLELLVLEGAAG